jgi:hypothetical protein
MKTSPLAARRLIVVALALVAVPVTLPAAGTPAVRPMYYKPAERVSTGAPPLEADLCVYTANAAGVIAAVHARSLGLSVVLLNPAWHVGGLTTGGLSFTDLGNKAAIGGRSRAFYRALGRHYGKPEEWNFEPHVAERTLEAMLREAGVQPLHGHYVDRVLTEPPAAGGAPRIREIVTTSGLRVRAAYVIDCSYEGDLMARAGVGFTIGRERNGQYGEAYNGQQIHAAHQFSSPVDPYVRPGDPASGRLWGIDSDDTFIPGRADHRVQAYNFRVCMTKRTDNRVPFPKPAGYDRARYELLARLLATGWRAVFAKFDRIQGDKTDTNNHGPFSTDYIGGSWRWPAADYLEREQIFQDHVTYQQGYHWFLANDPAVPEAIRQAYAEWGLARDEFTDSGNWPRQLYIREARRMVADAVMTERHCLGRLTAEDPIGMGAYQMDSHNVRRLVHAGIVLNEGDVQVKLPRPYGISYRSIVPKRTECANLLVPVAVSASHIAFGSIRMEPVFMILAESAATAAAHAFRAGRIAVQDVDYPALRARLLEQGQVLTLDSAILNTSGNEALAPTAAR